MNEYILNKFDGNFLTNTITRLSKAVFIGVAAFSTGHASVVVPNEEVDSTIHKMRAAHFLSQATMGGTIEEVDALAERIGSIGVEGAFEEWIDNQFNIPIQTHEDGVKSYHAIYTPAVRDRLQINFWYASWWDQAINGEDQLRQRMAWALSQIFVVSTRYFAGETNDLAWQAPGVYYDILKENAFGDHDSLLYGITRNPLMGGYLGAAHNGKGDPELGTVPDENYAREIMQLFSCGLFERNMDGTIRVDSDGAPLENYTNDDVMEMAQVFTGYNTVNSITGKRASFFNPNLTDGRYFTRDMVARPAQHDTSSKEILGYSLPAGQALNTDVIQALDILAEHPSTAPHLSIRLIQRLTSSNPSNDYVNRVATVWSDTRGDFKAVIKAILLDEEAIDSVRYVLRRQGPEHFRINPQSRDNIGGKITETVLKWTQLCRVGKAQTLDNSGTDALQITGASTSIEMIPLEARSVFNFYDAEYTSTTGPLGELRDQTNFDLVSPESEILTPIVINEHNRMFDAFDNLQIEGTRRYTRGISLPGFEELFNNYNNQELLDILDIYLCHGKWNTAVKESIINEIESGFDSDEQAARIVGILFNSPDYSIVY